MKINLTTAEKDFESLWSYMYDELGLVSFDASLFPSYIVLDLIIVPKSLRMKGVGTKAMNLLCEYADKNQRDILLIPDDGFGTPKQVLQKFYGTFGFKKTKNDCHSLTSGVFASNEFILRKYKKQKL